MSTTKLTLSVDPQVVREAKRSAAALNTSLSSLFSRLLRAIATSPPVDLDTSPVTRRATGLAELPQDMDDRDLLTDALAAKYQMDP